MEASAVPRRAPVGVSVVITPRMLRMAPDSRLVALIREGRGVAFEALYDRHHRAILSFCHHMLGNPEEAEDAVQHTFLAAYNALAYSDEPIHLRAWLFAIARNRCYSILRRGREQPLAAVAEPATDGLASQVQLRQDLRDLVIDVRRLPDDQRAALVLAELDALSHEQIALVLGVPTRKVKALVFQARESLLASRTARDTDCAVIREQLANLHGGALRRSNLRRHLRDCAGCREFREHLEDQRSRLRVVVPVGPTVAVKEALLAGTIGDGAPGGGLAAGGVVVTSTLKGAMVKSLVGAVLAGAGAAGTIVAVRGLPRTSRGHATPKYALSGRTPRGRAARTVGGGGGGFGGGRNGAVTGSTGKSPSPRLTLAALTLPAQNRGFAVGRSTGGQLTVSPPSRSGANDAARYGAGKSSPSLSLSSSSSSAPTPTPSSPQAPEPGTSTGSPALVAAAPTGAEGGSPMGASPGAGAPVGEEGGTGGIAWAAVYDPGQFGGYGDGSQGSGGQGGSPRGSAGSGSQGAKGGGPQSSGDPGLSGGGLGPGPGGQSSAWKARFVRGH